MKQNLVEELLRTCVVRGCLPRRNGGFCSNYVDGSKFVLNGKILKHCSERVVDLAVELGATHIAGEECTALPIVGAAVLAANEKCVDVNGIVIRKQPKAYGTTRLVEGNWLAGDKILLVDDVCGRGNSLRRCTQILVDVGLIVVGALVVVERDGDRIETELGFPLRSLFRLSELIKHG